MNLALRTETFRADLDLRGKLKTYAEAYNNRLRFALKVGYRGWISPRIES